MLLAARRLQRAGHPTGHLCRGKTPGERRVSAPMLHDVPKDWQAFLLLDGPVHFAYTAGQYGKAEPEPNVVVLWDCPPLDGDDPPLWIRSWFRDRGAALELVPAGDLDQVERVVANRQGAGPLLVLVAPTMHHFADLLNWLLYRRNRL